MTVVSKNAIRSPYTIRDAETWEVLFRSKAGDPVSQRHNIGKGRLISFVVAGDGPHSQKRIMGIDRFVSATRGDWFAPSHSR